MCNYQGYEFGARYPDSVCIDGRLFDADYCDDNGNLYDREDDVPCPMCRREDAVKWHAGQFGSGTYKERMKSARHLVADIINNRKTGNFPLRELAEPSGVIVVASPSTSRADGS
jgi:hypothetical protein